MSYPINYPTPQGANVQIFYAGGTISRGTPKDWVKPQGASFVFFTLIGAGGGGSISDSLGGQSGAVTNFMGPAFLMPDVLRINVGVGTANKANGSNTTVVYQAKDDNGYTLLTALGGGGGGNGDVATASPNNAFTAMGFYQSVGGQQGTGGAVGASSTTFLGGGGYEASTATANYGYSNKINGFFQMQPIIVGSGGVGIASGAAGQGGIGCGGGVTSADSGRGGDGLAIIVTW